VDDLFAARTIDVVRRLGGRRLDGIELVAAGGPRWRVVARPASRGQTARNLAALWSRTSAPGAVLDVLDEVGRPRLVVTAATSRNGSVDVQVHDPDGAALGGARSAGGLLDVRRRLTVTDAGGAHVATIQGTGATDVVDPGGRVLGRIAPAAPEVVRAIAREEIWRADLGPDLLPAHRCLVVAGFIGRYVAT
jgi:hypothetical protein